jgi:hypothetical protein
MEIVDQGSEVDIYTYTNPGIFLQVGGDITLCNEDTTG